MIVTKLIETWEKSLCHANSDYQMIVMEKIAKSFDGCGLSVLQEALSLEHPTRKPSFFSKNHRVFEVLVKKGMIRVRQDPSELVYSLNVNKASKADRQLIQKAAIKAKKAWRVRN